MPSITYDDYLIGKARALGYAVDRTARRDSEWYSYLEKFIEKEREVQEFLSQSELYNKVRKESLIIVKGILLERGIPVLDVIEDFKGEGSSAESVISYVYIDLEGEAFKTIQEEIYARLTEWNDKTFNRRFFCLYLKPREEWDILMEDFQREKEENTSKASLVLDKVKSGLENAISDRSDEFHHQHHAYTILGVASEGSNDFYKVAYLNHETFDIIRLKIACENDFKTSMRLMQRSHMKKNSSCLYEGTKTFMEKLEERVREALDGVIRFGDTWIVFAGSTNLGDCIYVQPCVRPGVYITCQWLEIKTNLMDKIYATDEEVEVFYNKVIEEVVKYAKAMNDKVEYVERKDGEKELRGFEEVIVEI